MAENEINAIRTYTVTPRWLLDAAQRHGLHVMLGLWGEQYVDFLDPTRAQNIEDRVRAGVAASPAIRPCSATRLATRSRPR